MPSSHQFHQATLRYNQAWTRINTMIREGVSWSGLERNCCFLNTRSGRFANISAISGMDFPDDGRGMASVDWDHDGKLDLWLANRTGPRVRFLHNEFQSDHHFFSLRLEGKSCNRDAIGARVELFLKNGAGKPLIKTLRAGEGYLSQSSKWIHFGLGAEDQIEKIVVRWPGEKRDRQADEYFANLQADQHVKIVQGSTKVSHWSPPVRRVVLPASQPEEPIESGVSRTFFSSRVPLPRLRYETYEGDLKTVVGPIKRPLLINLWASWCPSCMVELVDFRDHQKEIEASNLDLLALSVDRQSGADLTQRVDVRSVLNKIHFPFQQGLAGPRLIEKIQFIQNQNFDQHLPLPMPTSILLDTNGDLAAIYRGPVSISQLLDDVRNLQLQDQNMLAVSVPFSGIWHAPPDAGRRILPIPSKLVEIGLLADAIDFIERHQSELAEDIAFPDLLTTIAVEFAEKGNPQAAEVQYRALLHAIPNHAPSLYNLAILLNGRGEHKEASKLLRQAAQVQPDFVEVHMALGVNFEKEGKFDEALAKFDRALQLRPDHATAHLNLAILLKRKGEKRNARTHLDRAVLLRPDFIPALFQQGLQYEEDENLKGAIEKFREILKIDPQHTMAHYHLGYLLQQENRVTEAIAHYRRASRSKPELPELYNNLAWLLATSPDPEDRNGEDAIKYAKLVAKATNYSESITLDTLAAAYAEAGHFSKAIQMAKKAVQIARSEKQDKLAERIENRLRFYQDGQPYHAP